MDMQKSTVIMLTTGLLLAAGVAAYELGSRAPASYQAPYSLQAEAPTNPLPSMGSGATSTVSTLQRTPNGTVPVNTVPLNQIGSSTNAPPKLTAETPVAAVPPLPGNSYEERTTTETTTTKVAPAPHRAYVRHHVRYKRNDKVHVVRAAKHTTMFALKLPGRVAL